ncbi:hypothetical protein ACH4PU_31110 [Streptomyces sp. NPDC021100]|uniref:hypothetical protein n=1 Tax=Streptomyces sp. NPDC021100 TaxID=3365114 RepID=UPI00379EE079
MPQKHATVADLQRITATSYTTAHGLARLVGDTLRTQYPQAAYLVISRDDRRLAHIDSVRDLQGTVLCDFPGDRIPAELPPGPLHAAWAPLDPQDAEDLLTLVRRMEALGGTFDTLPDAARAEGDAEDMQCLPLSPSAIPESRHTTGDRWRLRPYSTGHESTPRTQPLPTVDLDALLRVFNDSRKPVIEEALRKLGLLWLCRNPACGTHNPGGADLCSGCGYDRDGKPLSDQQPGLYQAPEQLWELLREQVRAWIGTTAHPMPDAVTFPYERHGDDYWSLTEPVLHYGGHTETVATDLADTEIDKTLVELADEVDPGYLEDLRITL